MTPLRQRFIEDLQLRNRSPKTIEAYVYHVRELACYFKQSPEQLGDDQVHRYLLHLLHGKKVSWSSYNQAVAALRFFYRVSSPSDTVVTRLPYGKRPKRLPAVRSPQQVALFLDTVHDRTMRVMLRTIYATGLRISEALHLTAAQIDSSRMVVRVLGKGQKERLVPLSPQLLEELRAYWRANEANAMDVRRQGSPSASERGIGAESLQAGLSRRGPAADHSPHASPLPCHAPSGSGGRHPNDPSLAGPSSHRHHGSLHARHVGGSAAGGQPARPPAPAAGPIDQPLSLGQLVRQYGAKFLERWPQCPHVRQTLRDLALCRTPALGGHVTQCDHCGEVRYHYHSCGNRSCPQCGGSKRAAWLAKCQADLLPVPYFHVVFTLPHELARWSWVTVSSCIGCSLTAPRRLFWKWRPTPSTWAHGSGC